jgi:hypothetical protein
MRLLDVGEWEAKADLAKTARRGASSFLATNVRDFPPRRSE